MNNLNELRNWVNDYMDELLAQNDIDGAVVAMSIMVRIDQMQGLKPKIELEVNA